MPTITQYLPPHHNVVDAAFEARFPDYTFQKAASVAELAQAMPSTDALLTSNPWYLPDVGKAVREHGKKLKWIQFTSVGIDTAIASGLPSGVPVTNVRGVRTGIIAGHAIMLMMGLMRGVQVFEGYRRARKWAKDEMSHVVLTAEGKTLVIVVGYK